MFKVISIFFSISTVAQIYVEVGLFQVVDFRDGGYFDTKETAESPVVPKYIPSFCKSSR